MCIRDRDAPSRRYSTNRPASGHAMSPQYKAHRILGQPVQLHLPILQVRIEAVVAVKWEVIIVLFSEKL